jgi:hypothetical protein
MSLDIKSYTDRLVQSYSEQRRAEAHSRLVAALRTIPPDMRESEAKAAIKRLARQELVEIKIKNLSEDELDRLSKRSLAEATEHRLPCVMLGRRRLALSKGWRARWRRIRCRPSGAPNGGTCGAGLARSQALLTPPRAAMRPSPFRHKELVPAVG